MKQKLLFFILLFSLILPTPALAQDSDLSETYTSDSGELTVSHPADWEVDDQDSDIYFHPADSDDVEIVFRTLNELIQETLGITHEMTAQEAMEIFMAAIPEEAVLSDDIALSEHGGNSVATIEVNLGGHVLASGVETRGGLVMVQAIGTEDSVNAVRDLYFEMIATMLITLSDGEEATEEDVSETIELSETYVSDNGELTVSHPAGWDVIDGGVNIFISPDSGDADFIFRLLTAEVQASLGIHHDLTAEEAMQIVVDDTPPDSGVNYEDIILADYGENSVATIEIALGEDYAIVTAVKTPGGAVMIQLVGTEDEVNAFRDVYFEMIAMTIITLPDVVDAVDTVDTETDEASDDITLSGVFNDEETGISFNYPDGWEVEINGDEIQLRPDDFIEEIEGIQIEIQLVTDDIEKETGMSPDMSAEEALETAISQVDGINVDDIVVDIYGENTVASIAGDVNGGYTFGAVVETNNGLVLVQIIDDEDQINAVSNIMFQIMTSISLEESTVSVNAIQLELNQSFNDEESGLSFDYPDGWEADTNFGGVYLEPDSDEFEAIEDLYIQFLLIDEQAEDELGINVTMGAEEAMELVVDNAEEAEVDLSYDDIVLAEYGDNSVASIEMELNGEYFIASIVETSGGIVMIQILGDEDEVNLARDVYFDILSTVNLEEMPPSASDVVLSETHESDNGELTFDYPAGWKIIDEDTSITIYNTAIGAEIEIEFWTEEVEENFGIPQDTSAGDASVALGAIIEESDIDVDYEKLTIGEYLVSSIIFVNPSTDETHVTAFVQTDEGVIMIRMQAEDDMVVEVSRIFRSIIETLDYQP